MHIQQASDVMSVLGDHITHVYLIIGDVHFYFVFWYIIFKCNTHTYYISKRVHIQILSQKRLTS